MRGDAHRIGQNIPQAAVFDLDHLTAQLGSLERGRRLAFAAYWSQRLVPFYDAFAKEVGDANGPVVHRCVELVWSAAAEPDADTSTVPALQAQLVEISPEIIDPPVLAYAAMESCSSAWDALNAVASDSAESAATAGLSLPNVVEHFLMNRDYRGVLLDSTDPDPLGLHDDPIYRREVATLAAVLHQLRDRPLAPAIQSLRALAGTGQRDGLVDDVVRLSRELRDST